MLTSEVDGQIKLFDEEISRSVKSRGSCRSIVAYTYKHTNLSGLERVSESFGPRWLFLAHDGVEKSALGVANYLA